MPISERKRQAILRSTTRIADRLERRYVPLIYGVLNNTNHGIADRYALDGLIGINAGIAVQSHAFKTLLPDMYGATALASVKAFKKLNPISSKLYEEQLLFKEDLQIPQEISQGFDIAPTDILADPNLRRWWQEEVKAVVAERVQNITDTSRKIIQEIVEDGLRQGLGHNNIADMVRTYTTGKYSRNRAKLIARTEIHGAQMATNDAQVSSIVEEVGLGPRIVREWVTAADDRARPTHAAADGQQVGMDDPFFVGGEAMRYPGDQNASAGNRCNCRCVVVYGEEDE